jgi:chemotaxis protein methyltransferase WspC
MMERFESLLKKAMGLDTASIGGTAVVSAVQARVRACEIADLEAYWEHVSRSQAELQALVEAVVVPETWFFRDREAFAAATNLLAAEGNIRRTSGAPLRLISLPCSTGEEPYSLAMALCDAGFPADGFRIDAVDISGPALEHARRGVYGRNSFRGQDLDFRDRHFVATTDGYRISETIRSQVRFSQGNLFELGSVDEGTYDVVFCRNLLIYFDVADQRRAVGVLRRLLAPGAVLFVGHSEASLLIEEGFSSARIPLAFAFRTRDDGAGRHSAATPSRTIAPSRVLIAPAGPVTGSRPRPEPRAPRSLPRIEPATGLEDIRRIADAGDLAAALKLGEAMLRKGQPMPDVLHLMAVLCEAAGDPVRAIDYHRKTLYLDPGHHEALMHLGLLLDKQGDKSGALRMRERARRLGARQDR